MSDFAGWLLGWFNQFVSWLLGLIGPIFSSLWTMLTDFLLFILDSVFDLVVYIVGGLSWDFGGFDPQQYYNQFPADLINALNLLHVQAALAMIISALGIRFVLQMIPFVRWGS